MNRKLSAENDRKVMFLFAISMGIFSLLILLPLYLSMERQAKKESDKLQSIKDTTIALNQPNSLTATTKNSDLRKKLCSLKARPEPERTGAIKAIKDLLENPQSEVVYVCDDSFYSQEDDKIIPAKTETYSVGLDTFLVNPSSNHVVQFSIKSGKFGFPKDKSNSYYTQKELEDFVRNYISKHSSSLGSFDLSKLQFEAGQKGDGVSDTNYFFTWKGESKTVKLDKPAITCSLDIPKTEPGVYYDDKGIPCIKHYETTLQPTLQIAITNKRYFLNYSNSFEGEVGREITF